MANFGRVLFLVAIVVILGGLIFVLSWDIPPPTKPVEVVIPDEKLPK